MSQLQPLISKLDGLIRSVSPQARREMAVQISRYLRQKNISRIKAQQNPDGSGFAPRGKNREGVSFVLPNVTFYYFKKPVTLRTVKDFGDYVVGFDSVSNGLQRCEKKKIVAPEGKSWAAGISAGRAKKMFRRLGTSKYLRGQASADSAAIQFLGRNADVAVSHQLGAGNLPQRELLGFSPADIQEIEHIIVQHLSK